jgi:hypothetical protein
MWIRRSRSCPRALFSIIDFLNDFEKVGTGVTTSKRFTSFSERYKAYDLFPVAALRHGDRARILTGRNETALSAAGVSRAGLVRPIMEAGVVVVAVMFARRAGRRAASSVPRRGDRSPCRPGSPPDRQRLLGELRSRFVNVRNPSPRTIFATSPSTRSTIVTMRSFVHAGALPTGPGGS